MIGHLAARSAMPPTAPDEQQRKLRKAAGDLEGLFVQQLFKAMRETVPKEEGIVSGGAGEDMFTGLLDQHLAAETPKESGSGIAEALYRQLSHRLPSAGLSAAPGPTPAPSIR